MILRREVESMKNALIGTYKNSVIALAISILSGVLAMAVSRALFI